MNQTIYIQKQVWKEFEAEPNKSAIVNELLRRHYGMAGYVNIKQNKDGTISPRRVGAPASFQMADLKPKFKRECREGHAIPDGRDKCLGKGCKYS